MDNFNFELETTTVWSFPERGSWKTHNGIYRGNFSPQIPRNIILNYSNEGDLILDPMMGSGTAIIEAKILNRRSIGIDINPSAVKMTEKSLNFEGEYTYGPILHTGDARYLNKIDSNSIDLIITHPPYFNIINYSDGKIKDDLSTIDNLKYFLLEIARVAAELYRVLKENSYCSILIGDTRKYGHYVPLSFYLLEAFIEQGFILKEDIIKLQHNCKSSQYWQNRIDDCNFYLIQHEHLFVFRKPNCNENISRYEYSTGFKN